MIPAPFLQTSRLLLTVGTLLLGTLGYAADSAPEPEPTNMWKYSSFAAMGFERAVVGGVSVMVNIIKPKKACINTTNEALRDSMVNALKGGLVEYNEDSAGGLLDVSIEMERGSFAHDVCLYRVEASLNTLMVGTHPDLAGKVPSKWQSTISHSTSFHRSMFLGRSSQIDKDLQAEIALIAETLSQQAFNFSSMLSSLMAEDYKHYQAAIAKQQASATTENSQ